MDLKDPNKALKRIFFFLPFGLYLGIAAQVAIVFILGILGPYLLNRGQLRHSKKSLHMYSFYFLVIWAVFPFADLINSFYPSVDTAKYNGIIVGKSQLPTVVILTALSFYLFSLKSKALEGLQQFRVKLESEAIFVSFLRGNILATCLCGGYFLVQHLTGFDYRREGLFLGANNMLSTGTYRIFGFFGHTLSISAVMLAVGVFYHCLLYLPQARLALANKFKNHLIFLIISHYTFVFLAGGRTAVVCVLIMTTMIHWHMIFTKSSSWLRKLSIGLALLAPTTGFLFMFGTFNRMASFTQSLLSNPSSAELDRFVFWKVYLKLILDSPFFGHGSEHLKRHGREQAYIDLGFADFEKKYNAHNIFLESLADIGVLGCLITILCCYGLFRLSKSLSKHDKLSYATLTALGFSILANFIHGLTQNTFFDAHVTTAYALLFWLCFWLRDASGDRLVSS